MIYPYVDSEESVDVEIDTGYDVVTITNVPITEHGFVRISGMHDSLLDEEEVLQLVVAVSAGNLYCLKVKDAFIDLYEYLAELRSLRRRKFLSRVAVEMVDANPKGYPENYKKFVITTETYKMRKRQVGELKDFTIVARFTPWHKRSFEEELKELGGEVEFINYDVEAEIAAHKEYENKLDEDGWKMAYIPAPTVQRDWGALADAAGDPPRLADLTLPPPSRAFQARERSRNVGVGVPNLATQPVPDPTVTHDEMLTALENVYRDTPSNMHDGMEIPIRSIFGPTVSDAVERLNVDEGDETESASQNDPQEG